MKDGDPEAFEPRVTDEDRTLYRSVLALRPQNEPEHESTCAGITDFLTRVDRHRTCHECAAFLLALWREDRLGGRTTPH